MFFNPRKSYKAVSTKMLVRLGEYKREMDLAHFLYGLVQWVIDDQKNHQNNFSTQKRLIDDPLKLQILTHFQFPTIVE